MKRLYDMIERPFLSIPEKTACPGKLPFIFSKIFRATRLAGFKSSLLPSHTTVSSIMFLRSHMYACHPSILPTSVVHATQQQRNSCHGYLHECQNPSTHSTT